MTTQHPAQPDPAGDRPPDDPVRAADEIIDNAALAAHRLAARRRRLLVALAELGLLRIVGPAWVTLGDDGFEFTDLDARTADRLVCALEDIAAGRPVPAPAEPRPYDRPLPGLAATTRRVYFPVPSRN